MDVIDVSIYIFSMEIIQQMHVRINISIIAVQ